MTKAMRETVHQLSKEYVMRQLEHLGGSVRQQDVNRAIQKVTKALLEVKAAQQGARTK